MNPVVLTSALLKLFSMLRGQSDVAAPPIAPKSIPEEEFSVKWLQTSLNKLSKIKLDVDGSYGPHTTEAVKSFQAANSLKADGWAGVQTCAKIQEQLESK